MGTWGIDTLENDAAADWVYELEESRGTAFLAETLKAVTESDEDYIEVDECHKALAAAEVIAALKGNPHPDLPPEVTTWLAKNRTAKADRLVQPALQAIELIKTDSELKELWEEGNDYQQWLATLANLETRLRAQP